MKLMRDEAFILKYIEQNIIKAVLTNNAHIGSGMLADIDRL